ncbi:MAG: hypothetical protein ABIS27_11050 [Longimicrobiales bacterium]
MADINIERKSPSIWPWIAGLLVLAVIVFLVMQNMNGGTDAPVAPADSTTVQTPQ